MKDIKLDLKISEKSLEDYLFNCRNHHELWEEEDHVFRQFNLGDHGFCDLLVVRKEIGYCNSTTNETTYDLNVTVYELKIETLTVSHLLQLSRYVSYVKNHLSDYFEDYYSSDEIKGYNVSSCLIGKGGSISFDLFYLCDSLVDVHDLSIYTYSLDYKKGIDVDCFESSIDSKTIEKKISIFNLE